MRENKLQRYLASCSGHELRRFRVFLQSPYFHQRPELLLVWDYLRPLLPAAPDEFPSPESLHAIAWPGLPFDMARVRHLQSDLCRLLEEFWQLQLLQDRPAQQRLLLLQALSSRGLDHDFDLTMVEAQTELLAQSMRDTAFQRQRFDLALLQHDHSVRRSNRGTQVGLQAAMEALDEEYLVHKLRLAAAAITRTQVLGEATDIGLLPEVVAFIDAAPAAVYDGSLVQLYRLVLRTLQPQHDHPAFTQLLQRLQEAQPHLPQSTLAELYAFALNYCVRMVNLAEPGFDTQLYTLYELLIARGYLLEEGSLPVQHFKNFVTLGLRLGQEAAVGKYAAQLARQLPPDIGPNAIAFSQAAIAFHLGEYRATLRLLQQVVFDDVFYHLDAKSLLLKAYYEQDEVEPLLSLLESFKIYLRRSRRISEYQRQTYRNQVKIVQQLAQHRLGGRRSIHAIREALASLRPIADLPWLERKVEELEEGDPV